MVKRNTEKQYACLFAYLVCKTVHIEVVDSLSQYSCTSTICRFVTRREFPEISSKDNAAIFLGAKKEFRLQPLPLNESLVGKELARHGKQWRLNTLLRLTSVVCGNT